jgi:hypothetical protein
MVSLIGVVLGLGTLLLFVSPLLYVYIKGPEGTSPTPYEADLAERRENGREEQ